jgi:hypothetical protein
MGKKIGSYVRRNTDGVSCSVERVLSFTEPTDSSEELPREERWFDRLSSDSYDTSEYELSELTLTDIEIEDNEPPSVIPDKKKKHKSRLRRFFSTQRTRFRLRHRKH